MTDTLLLLAFVVAVIDAVYVTACLKLFKA